jgi:hypothetical protein
MKTILETLAGTGVVLTMLGTVLSLEWLATKYPKVASAFLCIFLVFAVVFLGYLASLAMFNKI